MKEKTRYTLGKKDRLKSRKAIEHLFKEGKSFSLFPFRVLYLFSHQDAGLTDNTNLRAGFTVSSRHFKKAVHRNRIKRLIRETWRLQKNTVGLQPLATHHNLYVFFIYTGKDLPAYQWLYEKMTIVITRLTNIAGENS